MACVIARLSSGKGTQVVYGVPFFNGVVSNRINHSMDEVTAFTSLTVLARLSV